MSAGLPKVLVLEVSCEEMVVALVQVLPEVRVTEVSCEKTMAGEEDAVRRRCSDGRHRGDGCGGYGCERVMEREKEIRVRLCEGERE
ncbi:hypothetical protein DEO72_LG5g2150 [Vigna unguiculata]|uniref:Uncharacterized protein n=1 Tax=Vigna unguiculata TaxID=3917 RepID=A0A4D6LYW2_VIGUN|nr:hypothetical protein DEO72_LG5g2150 [Vigna unguiculata]